MTTKIAHLMMDVPGFKVVQGDIMLDRAKVLVVPVNCVPGVMGAGLAKRFADTLPELKDRHRCLCKTGGLGPGRPAMVYDIGPKALVLFPTKIDYRDDAHYHMIFAGLANLYYILNGYRRDDEEVGIAFPALGCGLGNLAWDVVAPMIRVWSAGLPERFSVTVYRPHHA